MAGPPGPATSPDDLTATAVLPVVPGPPAGAATGGPRRETAAPSRGEPPNTSPWDAARPGMSPDALAMAITVAVLSAFALFLFGCWVGWWPTP